MNRFNKIALAAACVLAGAPAFATPASIQNGYVLAGVSDYGTLGSDGATSPGILFDKTGTLTRGEPAGSGLQMMLTGAAGSDSGAMPLVRLSPGRPSSGYLPGTVRPMNPCGQRSCRKYGSPSLNRLSRG